MLARPARTLALEPFFMEFIAGVESEFARETIALTLQLVEDVHEEIRVYRRWWGEHRVDGILMVDLRVHDPRVDDSRGSASLQLWSAGLSKMALYQRFGTMRPASSSRPCSTSPRSVTGASPTSPASASSSTPCSARPRSVARRELGLTRTSSRPTTARRAALGTRRLLSLPDAPTAIVFDSDLLAVTGLGVAQQMGFSVPDDVSIVGWDDSLISQVVHPPLTAITRDIQAFGVAAARHLLAAVEGVPATEVETMRGELTPRGSTGRPAPRTASEPVDTEPDK